MIKFPINSYCEPCTNSNKTSKSLRNNDNNNVHTQIGKHQKGKTNESHIGSETISMILK